MSKKIKPTYSINLEELIKEQGIQKKELAKKIHTTPQTISKACQGLRLTRTTAERIIEEYPQYNIGWLLGYSEVKYIADIDKAMASAKKLEKYKVIEADASKTNIINIIRQAAKESFIYSDLLSKAADTLLDCRNELCLKCEGYKQRYLSPCENCRWKDV